MPHDCFFSKGICVDYTELNKVVRQHVHPMTNVDDSLAKLGTGEYFTKLDANSVFWQIPQSSRNCSSRFSRRTDIIRLSSSPEIFQKFMSEIPERLEGVICHMDDICIWGARLQQYDHRVGSVLN